MVSISTTQKWWFGASALVLAAYTAPACAQAQQPGASQGATLEEVIVTAQRREEKLQETPLSITAITADDVDLRGIKNSLELSAAAPNLLTRPNPGAAGIATISIRGSVSGQPAIWVDPPVGMYLDGVYLGKAQGGVLDVVDIERIEVLRGPQGTLFGRNTEGGAVNFVSRQPSGEFRGTAELSGGDYNRWIGRLNMDLPKWGILSANLAARMEVKDGWAENVTGPDDAGDRDQEAYRAALKFDFTDDFIASYAYDFSKTDNTPILTSLYALDGWAGTFPSVFGPAIGGAIQSAMAPYVVTSRPDKFSSPPGFSVLEKSESSSHTVVLDWQAMDTENLKYIFAMRSMDYEDEQSINGTPLTGITVTMPTGQPPPNDTISIPWGMDSIYHRMTDYEQTSHELQWLGDHGKFHYVVGLYYFEDEGETYDPQNFSMFAQAPFDVLYGADTEAEAVFAQADWEFIDRWTVTAGIRYTEETRDGFTHKWLTDAYKGNFVTDDPVTCASLRQSCMPRTSYSAKFSGTTPMGALSFKFSDDLNLFARVARGFKSGGFSSELINPLVTTPYEPQFSTAYELGAKSTLWDGRAILNATLFYTELEDQQTTILIPGTTQSILQNAGEGTNQGIEIEGRVLVTDGWTVGVNYGYLDADYDKYMDNSFAPGRPVINTAPNRLPPYAPENTLGLNVDGELLATSYGNLRLIVDYTYIDSYYLYPVNEDMSSPNAGGAYSADKNEIPASDRINLRLLFSDIPVGGNTLDLSLLVQNLADSDEVISGIDFSMFRTVNWQEPRSWLLTAAYKW